MFTYNDVHGGKAQFLLQWWQHFAVQQNLQYYSLPEISEHNPGALFRKSLSNDIDFLNHAPWGSEISRAKYCQQIFNAPKIAVYLLYLYQ